MILICLQIEIAFLRAEVYGSKLFGVKAEVYGQMYVHDGTMGLWVNKI